MSERMTLDELVESCTDNPNADDIRQWIVDFVEQSIEDITNPPPDSSHSELERAVDLLRAFCVGVPEHYPPCRPDLCRYCHARLFMAQQTLRQTPPERGHSISGWVMPGPWIAVSDGMPKTGRTVLIAFKNSHGNWRITRGLYVRAFEMVDESDDPSETGAVMDERGEYFVPEGWNESGVGAEFYYPVEGEVTHWMALPAAPSSECPTRGFSEPTGTTECPQQSSGQSEPTNPPPAAGHSEEGGA